MAGLALCIFGNLYAHDRETGYPGTGSANEEAVSLAMSTRYESRYFSEGRDALDGDSLWVNSIGIGYGMLGCEIWYGNSPDSEYDELQVSLAASYGIDNIEITAGFTYFEFPFEDADDKEVGVSVVIADTPFGTEIALDAYYSFEAGGYFAEVSLGKEIVSLENFSANLTAILGNNQGYVSDGHDGANHFAVVLAAEIQLSKSLVLGLHSAYSWALDRDIQLEGDQQLIDFLHGSIGLQWEF